MAEPARILLVEDHEIVRVGLRELVDSAPDLKVCGEVATLSAAIRAVSQERFDLVLLDLSLGREDGSILLRELPRLAQPPRVLVLSMHDDAVYGSHLVGLGARGFVRKGVDGNEILRAIRAVLAGEIWLSPRAQSSSVTPDTNCQSPPVDRLTSRERQVLEGVGRGESSKEIAGRLGLSAQTVDVYRFKIRQKLGVEDPGDLRQFAIALHSGTAEPTESDSA